MASLGWEAEDTVCPVCRVGMLRLRRYGRPHPPYALKCEADPDHVWYFVASSGPYGNRFVP